MAWFFPDESDVARGSGRLWLLTRAAFLLFVIAVGSVLWFSHQAEVEERRATMISDMLWLEQDLRFLLQRNEELLAQVVSVRPTVDTSRFASSARVLIANNSGIQQIFWLDPSGQIKIAEPNASDAHMIGEEIGVVPSTEAFRLAGSVGRASYSSAYPIIDNDWQFEVHVPVFRDGRLSGVVVGIYSLKNLINKSVPWWLTERYRISVTHYDGRELISRSKIAPLQPDNEYQVSFEPPGRGLSLRAVPYGLPPPLISKVLNGVLIFLAIAVLLSLWALRKHVQRRLSAEAEVREQYAFRKAMEDSMHTGLRARDLSGRITYVNPAFCKMVGWSADELVGRDPPMPYWTDEDFVETQRVHDRILAGEGSDAGFELRLKRRDGSIFTALIHEAPLIDADGKHSGWMGSMVDITDIKRAEEHARLQQERMQVTSRLVSMGEMASSLAHEINQPLAAISSYCTAGLNLLRNGSDPAEIAPAIERAVEQAQRAGQIVRRIYSGVRRSDGKTEVLDLKVCLMEALSQIEHDLRRQNIQVVRQLQDDLAISGDPVLMQQVIFNLLRNAAESMRDSPAEQRSINVTLSREDDYAMISIADHGAGIDPELSEKVFDPLFTTKSEGMGMGLSICRSVVENHRGRIWFDANRPQGTVFHLIFPMAAS